MKDGSSDEDEEASDDSEENPDADLGFEPAGEKKKKKKKLDQSHDKIEVNFDDIPDDDDQECLLDYQGSSQKKPSLLDEKPQRRQSGQLDPDLFKIKESNDKGLADMETGSEVYMSELLVS